MKVLGLLGLSFTFAQGLKLEVNIKEKSAGHSGQPPIWKDPDWEGYPCWQSTGTGTWKTCPGWEKTWKVWSTSECMPLDKGPKGSMKASLKLPLEKFVMRCQKKCASWDPPLNDIDPGWDDWNPKPCSLIEVTTKGAKHVCQMKGCKGGDGMPKWAPEPDEERPKWIGWKRVQPGWWSKAGGPHIVEGGVHRVQDRVIQNKK